MGYWKDVRERLGGGNAEAHEHEYVCAACFDDDDLRGLIESEARANCCTFCGAESADPIAAPLVEVLLYINECITREYDAAENKLFYDSELGGYMGEVWTTMELLERYLGDALPNDDEGALIEDLCDGLGERAWCRTKDEKLTYSWEAFCELIKHRRRYFFLREPGYQELFSPFALLEELESWCKRFELIETLPANRLLYRARLQKPGEKLETAAALGPPPQDKAIIANRMSPPGIVMFYASDEAETALREVAKDPARDVGVYTIGTFRTLRQVRILDLTDIPGIPSIFEPVPDSLEYDPRPPLIFLNYFAAELSMPIARDSSVHVEYIPAQVVTEYFRTEFAHDGGPLAGIRYQSARHAGGGSLVLFASQDNLADVIDAGISTALTNRDRWIELVGCKEREVTADDLERWDSEAPQPFDWV